MYLRKSVDEK